MGPGNFAHNKVSVIIPTYNYGRFVTECVDSVLAQENCNFEIIVIDDGSTDNTVERLKPYSSRIQCISQENRGLSAARNLGLSIAEGEYIQFLDSDDLLGKNALAGRVQFLESNPKVSTAVCRNRLFTQLDRTQRPDNIGSWKLFRSRLSTHLCHFNIAPPHAFLFRKEVIDQTGLFDESLKACEDYDYWTRATSLGFTPEYCPKGIVHYRIHPSSMSSNRVNQVHHDALLHHRLFKLVFEDNAYPVDSMLACSLSFGSGLAMTIARLEELNGESDLLPNLYNHLQFIFDYICDSLPTNSSKLDPLCRLYKHLFFEIVAGNEILQLKMKNLPRAYEEINKINKLSYLMKSYVQAISCVAGDRSSAYCHATHIQSRVIGNLRRRSRLQPPN